MAEENRAEPDRMGEPGGLPERSSGGRPHWTARPWPLLAAVLAAYLIVFILELGLALFNVLPDQQTKAAAYAALLISLQLCVHLALSLLLFWFLRRAQLKSGTTTEISWKTDVVFWIAIPLTLAAFIPAWVRLLSAYPSLAAQGLDVAISSGFINTASGFVSAISSGLVGALFFGILFPVMEKRFGTIKGAVLIAAAFAALSAVESIISAAESTLLFPLQSNGAPVPLSMLLGSIVTGLISGVLMNAALYMVRSALYLAASRRVPGTWLLFASVPWLLRYAGSELQTGLARNAHFSAWLSTLCIEFPYCLVLFALGLGAVMALRKWKMPETIDFKEILHKIRSIGE